MDMMCVSCASCLTTGVVSVSPKQERHIALEKEHLDQGTRAATLWIACRQCCGIEQAGAVPWDHGVRDLTDCLCKQLH